MKVRESSQGFGDKENLRTSALNYGFAMYVRGFAGGG